MIKYHYYLSGPMTGYPNFNFEAFHSTAESLRVQGFSVYNPAESFNGAQDLPWTTYMKNDYDAIIQCDSIMVLDGWEMALGANLEVLFGLSRGMSIFKKTAFGHVRLFNDKGDDTRNDIKFIIQSFRAYEAKIALPKIEAETETPRPIFNSVWTTPANLNYNISTTGSNGLDFTYVSFGDPLNTEDLPEMDETILEEAQRLVHGDRGTDYGHPLDDFTKSALIATAVLYDKLKPGMQVVAEDIPLIMQGVKISREINSPKRDNRTDGAGYWETLDMVRQERDRRSRLTPKAESVIKDSLKRGKKSLKQSRAARLDLMQRKAVELPRDMAKSLEDDWNFTD